MSTETTQETTTVEQVDIDLDNILGTPGADSIMLPEDKKPSMFSKGNIDTAFLDKPEGSENDPQGTEKPGAFEDVLKDVDPAEPVHQERIVREYLSATNFGTPEEIQEEIESWKDRGDLEAKANKFKPKLDAMQARVVQQKLAQQEEMKRRQQSQAQAYMENVYNTLSPGDVNGIKLDRRTQELLYTGLVQPNYPSISGRPTNLLGHLLEKYQYIEPNHSLIAEALWLLADPNSYKTKIREQGQKETVEKTARMLKTEEARRSVSSPVVEQEEVKQRTIKRSNNFFKR